MVLRVEETPCKDRCGGVAVLTDDDAIFCCTAGSQIYDSGEAAAAGSDVVCVCVAGEVTECFHSG